MHGYRYQCPRKCAESDCAEMGFPRSACRTVSPLMKFVSRGDTTVVDAYLSPILRRYVEQVQSVARRRAAAVHAVSGG